MLSNFETNKVFIAKGLSSDAFCQTANSLVAALEKYHVVWSWLPCSSSQFHIWARDYIPVQVSEM